MLVTLLSAAYDDAQKYKNSYASVTGMILYLAENHRIDNSFGVNQRAKFTSDTKKYHD